jgi:hypothetical protein
MRPSHIASRFMILLSIAIFAVTLAAAADYFDKETTLTNPDTGDTVTLHTSGDGTYAKHVKGPSGYILQLPRGVSKLTTRLDLHDYYVRDYEKFGYIRDE